MVGTGWVEIEPHSGPDQFRNAKLRRCSLVRYAVRRRLRPRKGSAAASRMVVASTL